MLSYFNLLLWFIEVFKVCPSNQSQHSDCGDKYPCWLSAAFGNLFMANFYCAPKEIRVLCILGKKNTPFKYSFFRGCVCVLCELLGGKEQSGFLWSRRCCLGPQTRCLRGEFLLLAQAHRPPRPARQHGTHPLFLAWRRICALHSSQEPRNQKERRFHSHPWLGNSCWSL